MPDREAAILALPPRPGGRPNAERLVDEDVGSTGDGFEVAGEVEQGCCPPSCGKMLRARSERPLDIMDYCSIVLLYMASNAAVQAAIERI